MRTSFVTYLFTFILITSIVLPAYLSLSENISGYSLVINDIEDDTEKNEKNNDIDVKIIHNYQEIISYKNLHSIHNIMYLSSEYNTRSINVDSPPPEIG